MANPNCEGDDYVIPIPKTECIGNSLATINRNFYELDRAICTIESSSLKPVNSSTITLNYNPETGELIANTVPVPVASHVLATSNSLGPSHTISGATAGHVLRATSPATAAFQAIQISDLPLAVQPLAPIPGKVPYVIEKIAAFGPAPRDPWSDSLKSWRSLKAKLIGGSWSNHFNRTPKGIWLHVSVSEIRAEFACGRTIPSTLANLHPGYIDNPNSTHLETIGGKLYATATIVAGNDQSFSNVLFLPLTEDGDIFYRTYQTNPSTSGHQITLIEAM